MRISALRNGGRRAANRVLRASKSIQQAVIAALEPLESRQLLSAGDQIGSTLLTDIDNNDVGGYVVRMPDQSLYQVGTTLDGSNKAFALTHYLANGQLDTSFGSGGTKEVALPVISGTELGAVNAVAVAGDGTRLIVVGTANHGASSDILIARFLPNGDLDNAANDPSGNFDGDGISTPDLGPSTEGYAVGIQNDGKIVVGGDVRLSAVSTFVVARYNTDGSLDHTFGTPDPLNELGHTGWASNAFVVTNETGPVTSEDHLHSLAIAADGKIVLGGSTSTPFDGVPSGYFVPEFALQRYNSDGSLDDGSANDSTPSDQFGSNGNGNVQTKFGETDSIDVVAIAPDGKILAGGGAGLTFEGFEGSIPQMIIARYNTDGSLDNGLVGDSTPSDSFNITGYNLVAFATPNSGGVIVDGEITDMEIQADGKVVAGASLDFCDGELDTQDFICFGTVQAALSASRLSIDGSLDSGFGSGGLVIGDRFDDQHFVHPASIAVQTDAMSGQQTLVVAGTVALPFVDGSPDWFSLARYDLDVTGGSASLFTPALNGPTTANEGDTVTFQGSVSGGGESTISFNKSQRRATSSGAGSGSTNYTWTVTKNGNPYATGSGSVNSGDSFNFQFVPNDEGSYHVTLSVDNGDGPAEADVAVSNVAPSVAISGPTSGVRDFAQTYTSTVSDPGTADTLSYSWTAKLGATTVASGSGTSFSFTPSSNGSYVVQLTVNDGDGGSGSDSKNLSISSAGVVDGQLQVGGSGGNDDITIKPSGSGVSVDQNGSSANYSGFSEIVVMGGNGNDSIKVNPGVNTTVAAFGGAGNDSIKGGGGNDILIGGDGNDLLQGQDGRDLLIGGDGQDHIVGQTDDDILVAGYSNYDSDLGALNSVLAEWISSRSYGQRTANIIGHNITIGATTYTFGGTRNNGSSFLTPYDSTSPSSSATVFDDADVDVMTGSSGQDLFLFNADNPVADTITDLAANEFAADIDFLTMMP